MHSRHVQHIWCNQKGIILLFQTQNWTDVRGNVMQPCFQIRQNYFNNGDHRHTRRRWMWDTVWPVSQHQPVMCSWSQQRRSNTERRSSQQHFKNKYHIKEKNVNKKKLSRSVLSGAHVCVWELFLINQSRSSSLRLSEHMEQLWKHLVTLSRKALEGETQWELYIQPQKPDCLCHYIRR